MSAKYDFYKNPSQKGSTKRTRYHARIVSNRTVSTDQLAEQIQGNCTVTTADVKAVLSSLRTAVVNELKEGRRVYIEGLGYLSVTLSCPDIQSPNEIKAQSIRFKSVAFRPEADLKKELRSMHFERSPEKRHSKELTDESIEQLLTRYFQDHPSMDSRDFQQLCRQTKSTANRLLKKLVEAGKLRNIGLHRFPVYEPTEGNFGNHQPK